MDESLSDVGERVAILRQEIKNFYQDCYYNKRDYKYIRKNKLKIFDTPDFKSLPGWAKSRLQGYREGYQDYWYTFVLEPRYKNDIYLGRFYKGSDVCAFIPRENS